LRHILNPTALIPGGHSDRIPVAYAIARRFGSIRRSSADSSCTAGQISRWKISSCISTDPDRFSMPTRLVVPDLGVLSTTNRVCLRTASPLPRNCPHRAAPR